MSTMTGVGQLFPLSKNQSVVAREIRPFIPLVMKTSFNMLRKAPVFNRNKLIDEKTINEAFEIRSCQTRDKLELQLVRVLFPDATARSDKEILGKTSRYRKWTKLSSMGILERAAHAVFSNLTPKIFRKHENTFLKLFTDTWTQLMLGESSSSHLGKRKHEDLGTDDHQTEKPKRDVFSKIADLKEICSKAKADYEKAEQVLDLLESVFRDQNRKIEVFRESMTELNSIIQT